MLLPEIYAALAAFAAALIALAVYHTAVVRPSLAQNAALLATHDDLLGGGRQGASERLSTLEKTQDVLARRAERAENGLRELDALSQTDLSAVGFVRYDAFDDTGSELSYALALLNRDGDGVVLTSIYSRTDTRSFGKAVQGYEPVVPASAEELRAIAKVRDLVSSK